MELRTGVSRQEALRNFAHRTDLGERNRSRCLCRRIGSNSIGQRFVSMRIDAHNPSPRPKNWQRSRPSACFR